MCTVIEIKSTKVRMSNENPLIHPMIFMGGNQGIWTLIILCARWELSNIIPYGYTYKKNPSWKYYLFLKNKRSNLDTWSDFDLVLNGSKMSKLHVYNFQVSIKYK